MAFFYLLIAGTEAEPNVGSQGQSEERIFSLLQLIWVPYGCHKGAIHAGSELCRVCVCAMTGQIATTTLSGRDICL